MDFQNAFWISGEVGEAAPDFRREFFLEDFVGAEITICGLGFFELYINGSKVSDDLLVPAWSNYEKRENRKLLYPLADDFSRYRTYFLRYNVEDSLRCGANAIGVRLGNGWYHQTRRLVEGELDYGEPKLSLELVISHSDGSKEYIDCSEGFTVCASEIVENNIFHGEKHDLRRGHPGWTEPGFDDSSWQSPVRVTGPQSEFCQQYAPADKQMREIIPQLVLDNGRVKIYDCGENITGYVRACLKNRKRRLFCQKRPLSTSKILVNREIALRFSP